VRQASRRQRRLVYTQGGRWDEAAAGGRESLTGTERAVSLLVAAGGLTNGAVARRLCISPRTMTIHLRHVFAKLAYRTGLRSPPWSIIRSSEVLAAGRRRNRPQAVS